MAATITLLGAVAGVPLLLATVGTDVLPNRMPTWADARSALTRRDDGTLALALVTVVAWLAWLVLTVAVVVEVIARLRGRIAPRLPGLRLPQAAAGQLVAAALTLFITTPLIAAPASLAFAQPQTRTPDPAPRASPAANHSATATLTPTEEPSRPPTTDRRSDGRTSTGRVHTVQRGESLWSIAAEHLGSGLRYTEIAALNADTLHGRPDFLTSGQVLKLPTHKQEPTNGSARQVTVHWGDTLSEIAEDRLGDEDRYPEIFRASTDTEQPDGRHLTDPDVIDVGWTLTIPSTTDPRAPMSNHTDQRGGDRPASSHREAPVGRPSGPDRRQASQPTGRPTESSATRPSSKPGSAAPTTEPAATPSAAGPSTTAGQDGRQPETATEAAPTPALPGWALTGLTGGGTVLAASLLLLLRRRRAAQYRSRRPGRTIAVPAPALAPVEKTLTLTGTTTIPTVSFVDQALRRLAAARTADEQTMPELDAVELTPGHLTLHLTNSQPASQPWRAGDDHPVWRLDTSTNLDQVGPLLADQPAPYPLLVTVGTADNGAVWLLNAEQAGILAVTGDPLYGQDLARYLAAEIACNLWSDQARLDCVGVADEVAQINPERVHSHPVDVLAELVADLTAGAEELVDRSDDLGADVPTARARLAGADAWPARMLLLEVADTTPLAPLLELLDAHPLHTGTALILTGAEGGLPAAACTITATGQGRLQVPHLGLDLVAVGLTSDEAAGCAALVAQADTAGDTAIPNAAGEDGWQAFADAAGAVRLAYTVPRAATALEPAASLLEANDHDYQRAAATTSDDLATLAPQVPARVRAAVEDADPTLDADLETWWNDNCDLPRLTLLGPVWARTHGKALAKRRPYYTELLAYLATHPRGATPDEVADAMGVTSARIRTDIKVLRDWLGTNPRTNRKHLPDARDSDAARARGISTYQVDGLFVDADLFRRLRVRGETRGPEGITDLRAALALVSGRPLDQLRPGGWTWMFDGDRLDQHLLCAIVDVAHLVTTHSLQAGNLPVARAAAETAVLAAPHEEIPLLDLATVAAAEGRTDEEANILHDRIYSRSDDNGPPDELPPRTQTILEYRRQMRGERAS